MKERPIIMQAESVRGILAGRKTQTRRIIKDAPIERNGYLCTRLITFANEKQVKGIMPALCPHGKPGDRLWVREAFSMQDGQTYADGRSDALILYRADGEQEGMKWSSPLFLQRCYARIILEITDIRVQKVTEITNNDAKAEGVEAAPHRGATCGLFETGIDQCYGCSYRTLWNRINGPKGLKLASKNPYIWDAAPWVWIISFNEVLNGKG